MIEIAPSDEPKGQQRPARSGRQVGDPFAIGGDDQKQRRSRRQQHPRPGQNRIELRNHAGVILHVSKNGAIQRRRLARTRLTLPPTNRWPNDDCVNASVGIPDCSAGSSSVDFAGAAGSNFTPLAASRAFPCRLRKQFQGVLAHNLPADVQSVLFYQIAGDHFFCPYFRDAPPMEFCGAV